VEPVSDALEEDRTLELARRIQGGDRSAWDELYRRTHDELLFLVRARLGARLRAALESEDILQSAAIEAFQALPRFEARGPGSLRRFLHTLVLNKIRDRADTFGAQKRAGAVPLSESVLAVVEDPSSAAVRYHDGAYDRLEVALQSLPADLREVLVLRRIEGLASQEVAERLGRSDAAVRKAYSRALARLSTLLDGEAG
jgi:RNA polymerase sigma-70 factor (ECF subfamily)